MPFPSQLSTSFDFLRSESLGFISNLKPLIENVAAKLPPWPTTVSVAIVTYLLLCRLLRYQRMKSLLRKYPYKTRESMGSMTNEHAFEIQRDIFEYEFPYLAGLSLQFALFKTYGIPTISGLLTATKQFTEKKTAGRRAVDTETLVSEFIGFSPRSERANAAIARMNWQHAQYQKAGKISNDDMLYTLALFALEPKRWTEKFEWRGMNEMEQCAIGVFWKSVGDAMKISYDDLRSSTSSWKDGLHWLEEVEEWSIAYEKKYMVPDEKNYKTAVETTALLLLQLPPAMRETGKKLITSLMDDRLRTAVMYPAVPPIYHRISHSLFAVRKFWLRHLTLPRFWPSLLITEEKDKNGRYHRTYYDTEPWYVPDTFFNRWSLQSIVRRVLGQPYPGPQWKPQGYVVEELGPKNLENKGIPELHAERDKLMNAGRGGCPFAVRR